MAVITAAVIAAGATVYASQSSANDAENALYAQQQGAGGGMMSKAQLKAGGWKNANEVYGSKIEPVDYTALEKEDPGYSGIARRVIRGNQTNLPYSTKLSADTNAAITASSKARINGFDPTMMASLAQLYQNRNNELEGNLPYEDAMQAMASRGRSANDFGQAGGSNPQTAADLGLSRLSLQQHGSDLSAQIAGILNTIDPIQRYSTPQDYQVTPSQAIPWAIADNQFSANFESQQNAIRAMPDPAAAGQFNYGQFLAGLGGLSPGMSGGMGGGGGGGGGNSYGQYAQLAGMALNAYSSYNKGGGGQSYGSASNYGMNYTGSAESTQAAQTGGYNSFTGNGVDSGAAVSEGASAPAGVY